MEPIRIGGGPENLRELFPPSKAGDEKKGEASFGQVMEAAFQEVNRRQLEGGRMAEDLAIGKGPELHQVMVALEKADISFRLATQVRNKLLSAYQEIMRMQV